MNTTKTKILFMIPSLRAGGAERVIVNLIKHLDRTKFILILAVVNMQAAVFAEEIPEDIQLIDLACPRVRYAAFKIIPLLWRLKPQVVFSTLGHLNLMLAMLKPLLPKNSRYLCRETTILSQSLETHPCPGFWRWAHRFFYGRFDTIVCQSGYMQEDLIANFGLSPAKTIVINNPVDSERILHLAAAQNSVELFGAETKSAGTGIINLVAVGRLVEVKGFDLLITALALVGNRAMHLTLLGEGPLKQKLQALTVQLGLEEQVRFAGFKKNPYTYIANADAYVLSSHYEGFPNVVLEALACGTPVIATPAVGGAKEILKDLEGCVLAKNISAEALAATLTHFNFGKRLSTQAVAPYAMKRIVHFYEQLLLGDARSGFVCANS